MARKEQGHAAPLAKPSRRVHQNNDAQFEEAPTPHCVNTYMRELSPDDAHEHDARERGLLRRRRAKRITDARLGAERAASTELDREVECRLDDVERREVAGF